MDVLFQDLPMAQPEPYSTWGALRQLKLSLCLLFRVCVIDVEVVELESVIIIEAAL